jgi:hypothetical protein
MIRRFGHALTLSPGFAAKIDYGPERLRNSKFFSAYFLQIGCVAQNAIRSHFARPGT